MVEAKAMAEVVTSKAAMKLSVAAKTTVKSAVTTKATVAPKPTVTSPTVATGAAMTSPFRGLRPRRDPRFGWVKLQKGAAQPERL